MSGCYHEQRRISSDRCYLLQGISSQQSYLYIAWQGKAQHPGVVFAPGCELSHGSSHLASSLPAPSSTKMHKFCIARMVACHFIVFTFLWSLGVRV